MESPSPTLLPAEAAGSLDAEREVGNAVSDQTTETPSRNAEWRDGYMNGVRDMIERQGTSVEVEDEEHTGPPLFLVLTVAAAIFLVVVWLAVSSPFPPPSKGTDNG